jgi:predicted nuclease with RNAse H fold
MLFADAVYIGIDPTAGRKPMHYAAIDNQLRLVAIDKGGMEDILAFVAGQEKALVAVDAPQSPNKGLMQRSDVRRRYNLDPDGKTWGQWKVCEYELRRSNIRLYNTPEKEEDARGWVRVGFMLFRRLAELGYRHFYVGENLTERMMLEVHPHACFTVMLGLRPFLKQTLEGRLQRQLILYLAGLDIPNPLRALEDITRHHLLESRLPIDCLYTHDQLDALVAAYTSYLIVNQPERIMQVGDREEGVITLPTSELKDFYP